MTRSGRGRTIIGKQFPGRDQHDGGGGDHDGDGGDHGHDHDHGDGEGQEKTMKTVMFVMIMGAAKIMENFPSLRLMMMMMMTTTHVGEVDTWKQLVII